MAADMNPPAADRGGERQPGWTSRTAEELAYDVDVNCFHLERGACEDCVRELLTGLAASNADLTRELADETRRKTEQIQDKHRILGEYQEVVEKLRKENADLSRRLGEAEHRYRRAIGYGAEAEAKLVGAREAVRDAEKERDTAADWARHWMDRATELRTAWKTYRDGKATDAQREAARKLLDGEG